MALPKLETPKYNCVLPIINETVYFRPFLVGEQKTLLIAQESDNFDLQLSEMVRLINVCCDNIDARIIPTIDLEYLFLQIRIKSVGETASVIVQCDSCEADNTVEIKLESAELIEKENEINPIVPLTDSIAMELQYPSYSMLKGLNLEAEGTNDLFKLMSRCVTSILEGDEIHTRDDFTEKELSTFFDSMSITMFENVQTFFDSIPSLVINIEYDCTACSTHNNIKLEGIGNFFG